MRVTAELDVQPGDRRVLEILGHDLRGAAVERERGDHHPPVTNRHEVRLATGVLLLEQRDRIGAPGRRHPSAVVGGRSLRRAPASHAPCARRCFGCRTLFTSTSGEMSIGRVTASIASGRRACTSRSTRMGTKSVMRAAEYEAISSSTSASIVATSTAEPNRECSARTTDSTRACDESVSRSIGHPASCDRPASSTRPRRDMPYPTFIRHRARTVITRCG